MRAMLVFLTAVFGLAGTSCGGGSTNSAQAVPPGSTPFSVNVVRLTNLESASQSAFANFGSDTLADGGVIIDTDDDEVQVELTGAQASATYTLVFCPFASGLSSCLAVGSFATTSSGDAQVSFRFPHQGANAGVFVFERSGLRQFVTGFAAPDTSSGDDELFDVHLQPVAAVNGQLGSGFGSSGSDPLQQSTVKVEQNGQVQIDLKAAVPSVAYSVVFCRFGTGPGGCFPVGSLFTSQQGNAQMTLQFPITGTFAGVFVLSRDVSGQSVNQFVTAFPAP